MDRLLSDGHDQRHHPNRWSDSDGHSWSLRYLQSIPSQRSQEQIVGLNSLRLSLSVPLI